LYGIAPLGYSLGIILGIGKLANPIKKKEVNGYTVKLSLMI
jgi:hypothetical protein